MTTVDQRGDPVVVRSSPITIGKHEWRLLVFWHETYGFCTEYEWRRDTSGPFRSCHDWPTHNGDDTHGGMPKGIQRLYNRWRLDCEYWCKQHSKDKHLIRPARSQPMNQRALFPEFGCTAGGES